MGEIFTKYSKKGKSELSIKIHSYVKDNLEYALETLVIHGTVNEFIDEMEEYYLNHHKELTETTDISYHGIKEIAWEELKQLIADKIVDYRDNSTSPATVIDVVVDYIGSEFVASSVMSLCTMGLVETGSCYTTTVLNYETELRRHFDLMDKTVESDYDPNYVLNFRLTYGAKLFMANPELYKEKKKYRSDFFNS